jgi:hypothetical protein
MFLHKFEILIRNLKRLFQIFFACFDEIMRRDEIGDLTVPYHRQFICIMERFDQGHLHPKLHVEVPRLTSGSAWIRIRMDPHHFGNLDPHPDRHPHKIKIWIRIRIKVMSWILIC